jgi:7-carboxy-7-deazaguanine synthase
MFGKNPIRPPEKGDGQNLSVQAIFPTLQGEGLYAGWPSVFVRLGGCNLACHFCDTEFESFRDMALPELLAEVQKLSLNDAGKRVRGLVVITGGEPLRQNIAPLCEALLAAGFGIQIETNGTLYRELPPEVDIICSPKVSGGSYHPLRPDLLARASALKFIVSATDAQYSAVPELGQGAAGVPVYVQPMDEYTPEKNAANHAHALALAMQHGYRLSLQTHKILDIE